MLAFRKIIAVIRCLAYKLLYKKQLVFSKFFFSGKNFELKVAKSSRIQFAGSTRFTDFVEIGGEGILYAGNHLVVNSYSRILAKEKIELGHDVLLARYVSILDHDHDINAVMKGNFKTYLTAPIKIGNYVWIGDKVTITKGVTIGDNVVIGANSVVTKDIPSNSIAVGSPCKVIKSLNPS